MVPTSTSSAPRLFHHLGHTEAATDFDALAPADQHLSIAGQRGEHEHDGSGVVVHDHRRLGAAQSGEHAADCGLTRAALAGGEIELDVDGLRRVVQRERGAPEVGVQQHAGRVHHG